VSEGRCVDKGEGRMVGLLKTEVEVEAEWRSAPRARERTAVMRRGDWRRRDSAGRDRTAIVPYLRVGGWLDVGEDNRFRSLREDFVLSEVSSIVVQSRVRSDKRDRSPQLKPSDDISSRHFGEVSGDQLADEFRQRPIAEAARPYSVITARTSIPLLSIIS